LIRGGAVWREQFYSEWEPPWCIRLRLPQSVMSPIQLGGRVRSAYIGSGEILDMQAARWLSSFGVLYLRGDETAQEPWSKSELIEPADLAKMLNAQEKTLQIICVTFPVLYRQKHVPHAQFAGPANKSEGIAALRAAIKTLQRNVEIVIYCGCCPMKNCPNIRPAYRILKEMGFSNLRVLNLPTNFHTDWVAKGYPVET
jgi:thiosulfate/3-mercaptopyruvate sulfurtransferase